MKNVIITILVMLVLGLCGYIVYDKVVSKDSNDNTSTIETPTENNETDFVEESTYVPKLATEADKKYTVDVDVSKYSSVFEYIANQDNVKISVRYCVSDWEELESPYETYSFSNDDVKKILTESKKSTPSLVDGLGGPCVTHVIYSYERKGVQKKLDLYAAHVISETNDGNIFKIVDSTGNFSEEELSSGYYSYSLSYTSSTLKSKMDELKS